MGKRAKTTGAPQRRRTVRYTLECLKCEGSKRTIEALQDAMPGAQRCTERGHGFRVIRRSEAVLVDA